jgi:hypothetical protein
MTAITLYQIADQFRADAEKLADLDLDMETLKDTLEGLSGDLEVKAQNVAMFARNLEAAAAQIKEAEAAMSARRKAIEKRAEGLRAYILTSMHVAGVQKIECPYFALSIKKNPPAVEILDPAQVPASFMRQPEPPPPAIDKKAIAEAIKAGQGVPGARLYSGIRLDIK